MPIHQKDERATVEEVALTLLHSFVVRLALFDDTGRRELAIVRTRLRSGKRKHVHAFGRVGLD